MHKVVGWKELLVRFGLLLVLGAMAQDFISGRYSPLLLAAGGLLLTMGLVANLVRNIWGD